MRSASSCDSVSTISTEQSRSPPIHTVNRESQRHLRRSMSITQSPPPLRKRRSPTLSRSLSPSRTEFEKKRRRTSFSSQDSNSPDDGARISRGRGSSRSTRRRFQENSPPARGRRTESGSPHRSRRALSNDRKRGRDSIGSGRGSQGANSAPVAPRDRSLSPFSKRLALTQSMNMGR
jgi:hypothetical protein